MGYKHQGAITKHQCVASWAGGSGQNFFHTTVILVWLKICLPVSNGSSSQIGPVHHSGFSFNVLTLMPLAATSARFSLVLEWFCCQGSARRCISLTPFSTEFIFVIFKRYLMETAEEKGLGGLQKKLAPCPQGIYRHLNVVSENHQSREMLIHPCVALEYKSVFLNGCHVVLSGRS